MAPWLAGFSGTGIKKRCLQRRRTGLEQKAKKGGTERQSYSLPSVSIMENLDWNGCRAKVPLATPKGGVTVLRWCGGSLGK